ncbi:MAG TPA: glycosyltransferase [Bradyrhizobium sp.]|jgi:hypothetical protein|nr:glycosyltransferase [Bradyrhizobium sp.]
MANSPAELTVIYPLIELREDTISPLRSWTRDQTLARERYRVIAVFAEADRAQAAAMEPLLGPNDELLPVPDRGFAAMLNAGTARARTPWLVMTEGHCIAQPGCLDQVMRWIETNPHDQVGNFEFTHFSRKTVNQLVGRWYEKTVAQWRTPPDWERAISGGFAIRKSLLDEVGPLQPAFEAFSPHAQSARLHSRGVKVVNVPGAAVLHLDEASMAEFYDSTERYIRGEFIARSQIDPAFMERYFGAPDLWINRARLERGTAPAMMRALIVAARTSPRRTAALAGAFASLLGQAAGGLRLRIALNRLWLAFYAMAIERLPMPDDTRFRHFLRSHQRAARLAQLEWLRENPVPPAAGLAEGRRAIDELGPGDIVGVYGLEEFGGRRFRWTEPVAMIRIAPRQTACELRLETGGIRGDPLAFLIAVVIAGRALPGKYCTSDDKATLTIHLPAAFAAAAKDGVVLVCNPLSPARAGIPDARSLGLPVTSIAIHPLP